MQYRKLGKFLLDRTLARGGMGEIIRSVDDEGRTVALKKILKEHEDEESFRALFQREAEVLFQLDHPNIIKAYGFDHIGRQLVLAMEYLEGVNLREILCLLAERRQLMPLSVAFKIMNGLLAGLAYTHKQKSRGGELLHLVHRDINPSNLFVTYLGELKILDFGITKSKHEGEVFERLTPTGKLRGKVAYLSPEQILAEEVDLRTDIFASGIVLWEMLAGEQMFSFDSQQLTLDAILSGKYPSLQERRPDLDPQLIDVVERALHPKSARRFKDAEEFSAALTAAFNKMILPDVLDEDVSVFVRTLFQSGNDEKEPRFLSIHSFLLCQTPGLEKAGVTLARDLATHYPNDPMVQLNLARCLLLEGKHKQEALRALGRLSAHESLEDIAQNLWVWLGIRRPVVVSFLRRTHPINRSLGIIRHKILGPTASFTNLELELAA